MSGPTSPFFVVRNRDNKEIRSGIVHGRNRLANGNQNAIRWGFGTHQWVIQGDVYTMDQTTVLGLFTYEPTYHIGADAENGCVVFSRKPLDPADPDWTID